MTVGELLSKLEGQPKDMEVVREGFDHTYRRVLSASTFSVEMLQRSKVARGSAQYHDLDGDGQPTLGGFPTRVLVIN